MEFLNKNCKQMAFDSNQFKKHLYDAEIASLGESVSGSQTLLAHGVNIRKRLYGIGIKLLEPLNFFEVSLSDFINSKDLNTLDEITKLSDKYLCIEGKKLAMAAGHEIAAYNFAKSYLKNFNAKLPLNFFQLASVYRYPRNTKFPFNYGERKSFLECYSIHPSTESAEKFLGSAYEWNRKLIKEILHLPSIEVERPLSTNKHVSRKTVCIDSLTPMGETVITGMTYFHDTIFTKAFNVKRKNRITGKNEKLASVHFGVSDNILFSYLMNAHDEKGFFLLSAIAPHQVSLIVSTDSQGENLDMKRIIKFLKEQDIRYEITETEEKNITKVTQRNIMRGVPVTVLIQKIDQVKCLTRFGEKFDISDSLEQIGDLLQKNDQLIHQMFLGIEDKNIAQCNTLNEANEVVQSGKVAKIYMENTEENIKIYEAGIRGGEVLGFATTANPREKSLAFISRRI